MTVPVASAPAAAKKDPLTAYGVERYCEMLRTLSTTVEWVSATGEKTSSRPPIFQTRYQECEVTAEHDRHQGRYTARVVAACQPNEDQVVDVGDTTGEFVARVPLPPPARRYLKQGRPLEPFVDSARAPAAPGYLPVNSIVEIVRRWPTPNDKCETAIVRVLDAGYPDLGFDDVFFKLPVSLLSETPVDELSATEHFTQDREAAAAREKEAGEQNEAVLKKEIDSGRCTDARYEVVSTHVSDVRERARSMDFDLLGHEVVVAKPEGTAVDVTSWLGGELHIFSVAFEPVTIEARDSQDYEMKAKSFFERAVAFGTGAPSDSRVLQARSGEKVKVTVKGRGCTLVVALRQR